MLFFTDTNIPLGYTIVHDKMHESSKSFIENHKEALFWSNLVKKEYCKKFEHIIDNISIFLETTEDALTCNEKDFVNYYEFEKFVLRRTEKCNLDLYKRQQILEHFWEKYKFNTIVAEILSLKFSIFVKDFEKLYYARYTNLNQIMHLHDCGLDNFERYLDYAIQLYE